MRPSRTDPDAVSGLRADTVPALFDPNCRISSTRMLQSGRRPAQVLLSLAQYGFSPVWWVDEK